MNRQRAGASGGLVGAGNGQGGWSAADFIPLHSGLDWSHSDQDSCIAVHYTSFCQVPPPSPPLGHSRAPCPILPSRANASSSVVLLVCTCQSGTGTHIGEP